MLLNLRRAVVASVFFALLLGLAYPLAETGLALALFPHQASGSLGANGSTLIGQQWKGPGWFHGRPDADDPMASGGTNLGPRSKKLEAHVAARIAAYRRAGIDPTVDLVTSSASGLDPDISPAAAYAQVNRVARARGLARRQVGKLVASQVQGPDLGFLGSPVVDVMALNEALAGAGGAPGGLPTVDRDG